MVNVIGLDIGGANTKAAYIETAKGKSTKFATAMEYFPFWKRDTEQFCNLLSTLKAKVAGSAKLDCVSVTITAELSDAYRTKREGVNHILDCISRAFKDTQILVVTVDATLESLNEAKAEPLKVAAANWAATGWMVSQYIKDCVVIDVGSTSTSIIPITHGKVAAAGKTDLEKLINGELIYTGSLRTNVAATVKSIQIKGSKTRVASELFALSGDAHLVLGNIKTEEYTTETADGKGKTKANALARLARVICADTDMLAEGEIVQIATQIHEKQVEQIAEGLNQVYSRLKPKAKNIVPAVVTGFGKKFLGEKAAQKAGISKIIDLGELLPNAAAVVSPAVGVALMAATKLEGRSLKWTL